MFRLLWIMAKVNSRNTLRWIGKTRFQLQALTCQNKGTPLVLYCMQVHASLFTQLLCKHEIWEAVTSLLSPCICSWQRCTIISGGKEPSPEIWWCVLMGIFKSKLVSITLFMSKTTKCISDISPITYDASMYMFYF